MEYEEMRQMEKTHCCAQCEGALSTIWDIFDDCNKLVCGNDLGHQDYKPILPEGQLFQRGQLDKKLGPGAQENTEGVILRHRENIRLMPDKDLATHELIPRDKFLELLLWGQKLSLKPNLGHVCLYYGKPYVTIDGYYYLLGKRGRNIEVGTRPLITQERERYSIGEGDHAWIAEAWENGQRLPTTGLGIVTKEEIEGKSEKHPDQFRAPVVHSHPQRMAEKRAEWQLLRKLIPLEEKE